MDPRFYGDEILALFKSLENFILKEPVSILLKSHLVKSNGQIMANVREKVISEQCLVYRKRPQIMGSKSNHYSLTTKHSNNPFPRPLVGSQALAQAFPRPPLRW